MKYGKFIYLFIYLYVQRHPQYIQRLFLPRWQCRWLKILWSGERKERGGWKLWEQNCECRCCRWRCAHLQPVVRLGLYRDPKTKYITNWKQWKCVRYSMSFGRGVIFEYVHKAVNLAIQFASSSDFDYLFKKPLQIYFPVHPFLSTFLRLLGIPTSFHFFWWRPLIFHKLQSPNVFRFINEMYVFC